MDTSADAAGEGTTAPLPPDWEPLYTGPSLVKLRSIWDILADEGETFPERDHSNDPW